MCTVQLQSCLVISVCLLFAKVLQNYCCPINTSEYQQFPFWTMKCLYFITPKSTDVCDTFSYSSSQPVTNTMVDPCYTSSGMAMEPLRFPNLVTGFERNPAHAARAALYTRYTPYEWTQSNISHYNEADTNRNFSERIRGDAVRVMRYVT